MRIYVGNLSFSSTEESVREAFERYGAVENVTLITDRETGRPRGFGFVEMRDDDASQQAIDALNQSQLDGRTLTVNEARPQERRGGGGGFGGGRGGGGRDRDRGRREW